MPFYTPTIAEIEKKLFEGNISLQSLSILEEHYTRYCAEDSPYREESELALARIYDIASRYALKKVQSVGPKTILYLNDKVQRNTRYGRTKNIAFRNIAAFLSDTEGLHLLLDMLRTPEVEELRIARNIAEQHPTLLTLLMTAAARAHKKCEVTGNHEISRFEIKNFSNLPPTALPYLDTLLERNPSQTGIDLAAPQELHIDMVVGRCNIACRFCRSAIEGIPERTMDFSTYKQSIAAVPQHMPIKTVLTPFTEPFIIKNYLDLLEYAILQRPIAKIGFNTNAVAMHKKRCERIVDMQVKYVNMSLNMPDKESYLWFHGKDFFDKVVRNIYTLIEIREKKNSNYPKVYIQLLEHEKTKHTMQEALVYWRTIADSAWERQMAIPGDTPEVRAELLNKIGDDPHRNQIVTKYPCYQIYVTLGVDINGFYLPCTNIETARSIHPTNPHVYDEMVIGHVSEMSFMEAWNSEKFKEIRALQMAGQLPACRGCTNRQYMESTLFGLKEDIMRTHYGV